MQIVDDDHLSRFACYLIARNGNPRKPEMAHEQIGCEVRDAIERIDEPFQKTYRLTSMSSRLKTHEIHHTQAHSGRQGCDGGCWVESARKVECDEQANTGTDLGARKARRKAGASKVPSGVGRQAHKSCDMSYPSGKAGLRCSAGDRIDQLGVRQRVQEQALFIIKWELI
ncbi:hypothetical protein [Verminephrobacter eiseniae]|uniref:hypothetical protein n=1 Tax=Verminephrobacter eiseniae TaxID=364317 RepID=UPI0022370914|nr:hypothetical protein [Verminephrobacter eiseniae]MCW5234476.1 hypothetical protein [Verminephrobacter eiseniae]MCW5293947.1 hypothetical protein [Verminephrobacter eiseniae]MCW8186042.1 hypothetical protein [Verminephrobacter eiseniae]MCW8222239.1 hypothetical protein [Verminephrobacter eiseniae]MCW8235277.1 hypothetical protein [Verminephrobacter eiseniae]